MPWLSGCWLDRSFNQFTLEVQYLYQRQAAPPARAEVGRGPNLQAARTGSASALASFMSVVAHSPYTGSKRLFDDSDHHQLDSQQLDTHKRSRGCGSPAGLYQAVSRASAGGSPFHQQHSSQAGVLNALRALFPGMDDQVSLCAVHEKHCKSIAQ